MKDLIKELYNSYKSPEARKVVEYVWDIADKSLPIEKIIEYIKNIADDSECLAFPIPTEKKGSKKWG